MANSAVSCGAVRLARSAQARIAADAEFLPQRAGGEHDAEFEHPLDLDLRDAAVGSPAAAPVVAIEYAIDALHQPFESGAIELIGAAETVHHAGLSPLGVGVPDAFGEGVVGDGRAVAVLPLGDAQIHASLIASRCQFLQGERCLVVCLTICAVCRRALGRKQTISAG